MALPDRAGDRPVRLLALLRIQDGVILVRGELRLVSQTWHKITVMFRIIILMSLVFSDHEEHDYIQVEQKCYALVFLPLIQDLNVLSPDLL